MKINLPNIITSIRIILAPIIFFLLINQNTIPAFILFLIAVLTDLSDGFVARIQNIKSKSGENFDALADVILGTFILSAALIDNQIQNWLKISIIIFILITFTIIYMIYKKKIKIPHRFSMKIVSFFIVITVCFFILNIKYKEMLATITILAGIYTTIDYLKNIK